MPKLHAEEGQDRGKNLDGLLLNIWSSPSTLKTSISARNLSIPNGGKNPLWVSIIPDQS
jgi:hypothetical protein